MKAGLILTAVLLSSCVHVNKSVLVDRSASPVPPADVYVYLANDEIPESCERVAILHASGDEDFTDEADIINKLREETGKLGGNAVHIEGIEDPGTGERVASALFGTNSDRDSQAIALWCPPGDR